MRHVAQHTVNVAIIAIRPNLRSIALKRPFALLTLTIALTACSPSPAPQVEFAAQSTWVPPEAGLLADAQFSAESEGRKPVWGLSQHAGEDSYAFSSNGGVLSIERTGPEPWGQAVQGIDVRDLEGRTIEFSAEISGSFESGTESQVQSTGIGARVLGYPPGVPKMAGRHIMVVADGTPEIGPGTHEWTRQSLRIVIPKGATVLQVAIHLGMHGTLHARGPSLIVLDAETPPDADGLPVPGTDPD